MLKNFDNDFTEEAYVKLLEKLTSRFATVKVFDALERVARLERVDGLAAWRHDVDFSPQRALALARLEAELGVVSTFFILLSGTFYNPLENGITNIIRQIRDLGHEIGLHFDASIYEGAHLKQLRSEANLLSCVVESPIRIFSLHNPSIGSSELFNESHYDGMLNATCEKLRTKFTYCSDSNGMWRYRPLHEVVVDEDVHSLYALTHPEWWTPTPMSPVDKIRRCIDGRAAAVGKDYFCLIAKYRPAVLPYLR